MRLTSAGWIMIVALCATRAAAQAPSAICTFDTARFTRMHSMVLGIAPAGPDLAPASGMDEVLWMADAIATHFQPPSRINLPIWARITGSGSTPGVAGRTVPLGHGFDVFFAITLRPDGRLAEQEIDVPTPSSELNEALRHAIVAADSAGAIPALSDSLRRAGGRARFRLIDLEGAKVTGVPLMRLTVPEIRATKPVQRFKPHDVAFPRNAVAALVSDSLEVGFVVNEDGSVKAEQVWPIRSLYMDFFIAVVEALVKSQFEPARVGECAVPSYVFQRFHFQVRR